MRIWKATLRDTLRDTTRLETRLETHLREELARHARLVGNAAGLRVVAHDKAPQVLLDHHRQHQGAPHLHIGQICMYVCIYIFCIYVDMYIYRYVHISCT